MDPFRVGRGILTCVVAGTGAVEAEGNEGAAAGREVCCRCCSFSCSVFCSIGTSGESGGKSTDASSSEQMCGSRSEKPDLQLVVRALLRQCASTSR